MNTVAHVIHLRKPLAVAVCLVASLVCSSDAADPTTVPSASCTTAQCHHQVGQHSRAHRPVAENRCDFCHEPKAGATPFLAGVRHEFKRAGDNAELCYQCHDRLAEQPHVHEPVKMGLCMLCHDPHGSERPGLLRHDTDRQLCQQCHRETLNQGDHVHGPVQVGACGACHDPHQSANRFRLRGTGAGQCGMCHLADVRPFLGAAQVHKPVAQKCSHCHEPHTSDQPFRLTNTDPRLCRDCHANIDMQVTTGKVVHKPIIESKCGACHEHHGSDHRRLLRGQFTAEPYEPFALEHYELCYRCHQSDQVTERVTSTATNFRNGDVNLHAKHVNQEEKGRTCHMCHQVHASISPRLLADEITFGAWKLPLNYQKTETGGSCQASCHRARAYDRITPIQNE